MKNVDQLTADDQVSVSESALYGGELEETHQTSGLYSIGA